jgi:hypothetical protein
MARGLSKLQKFILRDGYKMPGGMTNRRILIAYYGFQPAEKHQQSCKIFFDVRKIGKARYNAASVAVVKAFNRLAARGLAERVYNHGIYLTSDGKRLAKSIFEKGFRKVASSNILNNVETASS